MGEWLSSHWLDVVLIVALLLYAVQGIRRGPVSSLLDSIGFFGAAAIALVAYRYPAAFLERRFGVLPVFGNPAVFCAIWLGIDALWAFASRRLASRLPAEWKNGPRIRWLGALPGTFYGACVLAVFLIFAAALPLPLPVKRPITDSAVARPLLAAARNFETLFRPVFGPLARHGVQMLTVRPEHGESVDLRFTTEGAPDPVSERELFAKVNEERASLGLVTLAWDEELAAVSRLHAADMFRRGYFSHTNPDGLEPSGRADKNGFVYAVIGENLALAPDVPTAHQGLMDSPGHRANILSPDFGRGGFGVQDGGIYGKMFVQMFAD